MKRAASCVATCIAICLAGSVGCGGSGFTSNAGDLDGGSAADVYSTTVDGGDGDGSTNDAGGVYVLAPAGSGKAYCDQVPGGVVAYLERCCTATDKTTAQYLLLDTLTNALVRSCETDLEASIAKGRLVYDATRADACYAAITSVLGGLACGSQATAGQDLASAAQACSTIFDGNVAAGQPCLHPYECADGLACVGYVTSQTGGVDGTCKPPPAIGEACGQTKTDGGGTSSRTYAFDKAHPVCASGAHCSATAGGTCVADKAIGQSCFASTECVSGATCLLGVCSTAGPSDVGGPCNATSDCKSKLVCEKPTTGTGTCQEKKAAGASCTGNLSSDCKGICQTPDGSTQGTCASFCGSG